MQNTESSKGNALVRTLQRRCEHGAARLWLTHYWPEFLATLCASVFALSIVSYAFLPTVDRTYVGFVQVDQPVYYACAREYFENGNGIFAANPYSNLPTSARIYSHLLFVLVGWLWHLTGLTFGAIDSIVRIIGGPLMLLLAGKVVRIYLGRGRVVTPLIALPLLGGGLAWFYASVGLVAGLASEWNVAGVTDLFKPDELLRLYNSHFSAIEYGYGGVACQCLS